MDILHITATVSTKQLRQIQQDLPDSTALWESSTSNGIRRTPSRQGWDLPFERSHELSLIVPNGAERDIFHNAGVEHYAFTTVNRAHYSFKSSEYNEQDPLLSNQFPPRGTLDNQHDERGFSTIENGIYLRGKKKYDQWRHTIGFSNPKNQSKAKQWLTTGQCPPKIKKALARI